MRNKLFKTLENIVDWHHRRTGIKTWHEMFRELCDTHTELCELKWQTGNIPNEVLTVLNRLFSDDIGWLREQKEKGNFVDRQATLSKLLEFSITRGHPAEQLLAMTSPEFLAYAAKTIIDSQAEIVLWEADIENIELKPLRETLRDAAEGVGL